MYYLYCPVEVERHSCWSIGHASSIDLKQWEDHAALFHSDPDDPSCSCLSTGSVIPWGDGWVMAFLANHNQTDPRVIFAASSDLHHWELMELPDLHIPGPPYSRRPGKAFGNPRWRDPCLFVEGEEVLLLMTAAQEHADPETDGVIALLRSRDLTQWQLCPPLMLPELGQDLECPKLVALDGGYQLWVSLFDVLQCESFAAHQPQELNPNTVFALSASRLEGPYRLSGSGRVLIEDTPGWPYACSPVFLQGNWYLLGTCWSDRNGDHICDPVPLSITDEGLRQVQALP